MTNTCKTDDYLIPTPHGQLFVRRWQPEPIATNTPLILIHDSLGCVALWRDFPEQLAHTLQRPVIAYDRLGFGQSDPRQAPPSIHFIKEEASIYFPLIKQALRIGQFALLGHSVGGSMALLIAQKYQQACQAVVSISTQPYVEERTLEGIRQAKQGFQSPKQFERLERWHQERTRWVLDAWTETWLSADFRTWNINEALPEISTPILAIHGDSDEYGSVDFPKTIVNQAGGNAILDIIPQCGHFPHRENTSHVQKSIVRFLKSG